MGINPDSFIIKRDIIEGLPEGDLPEGILESQPDTQPVTQPVTQPISTQTPKEEIDAMLNDYGNSMTPVQDSMGGVTFQK